MKITIKETITNTIDFTIEELEQLLAGESFTCALGIEADDKDMFVHLKCSEKEMR